MNEFSQNLRLMIARLYEHEPDAAALFSAFARYKRNEECKFTFIGIGRKKLERAIHDFGDASSFEQTMAAANSREFQNRFGIPASLALHWYMIGQPTLGQVVEGITQQVLDELRKHAKATERIDGFVLKTFLLIRDGD